jgi:hypothetical protein
MVTLFKAEIVNCKSSNCKWLNGWMVALFKAEIVNCKLSNCKSFKI